MPRHYVPGRLAAIALIVPFTMASAAWASVFSMPAGQTSLQFVAIGSPGNTADSTGRGAVAYQYEIGEFDVTAAQYAVFLNAVAKTDTYGLYKPIMGGGYASPGITRSGSPGSYTYAVSAASANYPINYVSWGDAARFVNWLSNGQPVGAQGPETTETGSYALNGATTDAALMAVDRSPGAAYAVPTEDEWYKAAYYKGGSLDAGYWQFPTQSNVGPSNALSAVGTNNANYVALDFTDPTHYLTAVGSFAASPSAYGTFDQGGDVFQWTEDRITDSSRGLRGGSFNTGSFALSSDFGAYAVPTDHPGSTGFRVVAVPEPACAGAIALAGVMSFRRRHRRRDSRG